MAVLEHSRLEDARAQTLALVERVSDVDLERVHSPLLSPLVWDLGHIAAFEDLWLGQRRGGLPLLRPELATVYDAFESPRAARGALPYLRRHDAEGYVEAVRERVRALRLGESDPLVEMVARHERQHAETMLQTLALAGLPDWRPPGSAAAAPPEGAHSGLELLPVGGASFPLGADGEEFAYDNELPRHGVEVAAFALGRVPVTNGDWRAFIEAGGYEQRAWWSAEGWHWRVAEHIERPLRWIEGGLERTLHGVRELELDSPVVHVSHHEADAFARSHGLRLPREDEWELAASFDHARAEKRRWPWGDRAPSPRHANLIESARFATAPPGLEGASPCGALGMIGDVWEWTSSEFAGYPGFRADPYPEYSEAFFGSGFRVLRGGSFATSAAVASPTFRNWDLAERRQIFSGLRVAAG